MNACALSLLALAFAGCAVGPRLDTPAADPSAPAATGAPMPRTLGADATTRKTTELLAAVGADKLDGLKLRAARFKLRTTRLQLLRVWRGSRALLRRSTGHF